METGLEYFSKVRLSSVQVLSHVQLFVTPWIAAHQASLLAGANENMVWASLCLHFLLLSGKKLYSR